MEHCWPDLAGELDRLDALIDRTVHGTERDEAADRPDRRSPESPLGRLARAFDLDEVDGDLLVLAVAPEADTRYQSLFAVLNGDRDRTWPTPEIASRLLGPSGVTLHGVMSKLAAGGALFRAGL